MASLTNDASPKTEIDSEMERLQSAINELDARVSNLLGRLSDIRTPQGTSIGAPVAVSANSGAASVHGKKIAECAQKITEINDVLIEATRSLAL